MRGVRDPGGINEPGVIGANGPDGTPTPEKGKPVGDSNINAFQHAWFQALAARDGFKGTFAWDAYSGGKTAWGQFSLMGSGADAFKKKPAYFLTQMFTHAMQPGWDVHRVDGTAKNEMVVAFKGPNQQSAVFALNQKKTVQPVELAGLTPGTQYHLVVWNKKGGGKLVDDGTLKVPANGVLRVPVPPLGVVALSTLPPPA